MGSAEARHEEVAMFRFTLGSRAHVLIPLALIVLMLCAGPALAQNLVVNGTFDHDISGWTSWNPDLLKAQFREDAGNTQSGGSGPGSLELQYFHWSGGHLGAFTDVPLVTEGFTYTLSGAAYVPDTADNVAQNVALNVTWYDQTAAPLLAEAVIFSPNERGKWMSTSQDFVAPPGAVSARVAPNIWNPDLPNETRPGIAYFDDIVFMEKGATTAKQVLFIPASASAHGSHGTFWTTTGWFTNKVAFPLEIRAAFLRQGADNTSALESLTTLGTIPANGYLEVADIVAKLGGAGLTGGIYLEAVAQAAGLPARLVELTTYTFTPNSNGGGGYGQGVPAVGSGTAHDVTISGIYQNAAYRTNIGALNTSASTVVIQVKIFGTNGSSLGFQDWTLRPYEHKQVSVTKLGVNSASGGYVTFTRSSSSGSFQAYATVVDQKTGDAVYTLGR